VARSGQAAVAVHRPGKIGKRYQGMIGHAAAHRPRIRPRMILAEQLRKTNGVGIQVGAQTIIGAGSNKVYHCIETHGRGANPSFRTHVCESNPFSSSFRSGRYSFCCDFYFIRATDRSGDKVKHINTNKFLPLTQKNNFKKANTNKPKKTQNTTQNDKARARG
jgi:hypothetical protein